MKKVKTGVFILLMILGACARKEKLEVTSGTPALAPKEITDPAIKPDGLDHIPLNTGTYQQLPQALTKILDHKYSGFILPEIPREVLKNTDRAAAGPYFIQEDLNHDSIPDYVVQFQWQDTTYLAAFLMQENRKSKEYILEKHPVKSFGSLLIISIENKNNKVKLSRKKHRAENTLSENAVVVNSAGNGERRYLYRHQKFIVY